MERRFIKHWTLAEEHFLDVNYGFMPFSDICVWLSRHSIGGIRQKAKKRGLTKPIPRPSEYHNSRYMGMSTRKQSEEMGASYSAVWRNRRLNKNK